jgi:hypothetical protein
MRYFTYIADQSFKTSKSGERLFYRWGPWARPYILPDAETEHRIYWKLVWQLRIMLGVTIFVAPLALVAFPTLVVKPLTLFGFFIAIAGIQALSGTILFAPDLQKLQRVSARLPLKDFYCEMARKHGLLALVSGLGLSLAFVAIGFWLLVQPQFFLIGLVNAIFFGLCSAAWGYAVLLKLRNAAS